ncbi:MAG: DUF1304 domain-containing protein [gamma proteobacterium endosymbiont of Lamellibrachia anaximandri]|nr:DUF1304 domain-containing protein [gamma proteobacterium endosymbiont of Lamellibrachia anaximandri]MBL3535559.1 DUF1304 domain-containing protein [gamma proteobacterium endosymbiont of Lamellibrachia anaximandri]MBL3598611.1 DUF1304 domain-containing protein [gamma proteobacterium endosymbiont of Lamellibrachia anaximandri]
MIIIANVLVGFVAFLHVSFLVLEMFLWDKSVGLQTFGHTREFARVSKTLAMNQGLYNGFLAAGLVWGLSLGSAGNSIKIFFLGCVVIAGIFGGITASQKILLFQALPAVLALAALLLT